MTSSESAEQARAHNASVDAASGDPEAPIDRRIFGLPAALLLVVACVALYAGRLSGPLFFDDRESILDNPTLSRLSFPQVLFAPRDTPTAGRPVANLSFALGRALLGDSPLSAHAVNLALHALVTVLGFMLLRTTFAFGRVPAALRTRASPLAFAAALLFAVHPVGVEVVLYATQRTEALMALFYVAALLLLATAAARGFVTNTAVVLMLVCSLLGAGSKEVFATAPVVALFFDRALFAGTFGRALRERGKLYAALFACLVPLLLLQLTHPRPQTVIGFSTEYLLAQTQIIPSYLGYAFWPSQPLIDFGPLVMENAGTSVPFILLTSALVLASAALAFTHPRLGVVGVVVFGVLAPSSSLFTVLTEIGAQRRIYLPLLALFGYLVVALEAAVRNVSDDKKTTANELVLLGCVLAASFAYRTVTYANTFQSEEHLWFGAIMARPTNPRAYQNLGELYIKRGQIDAAERAYIASLQACETYPNAYNGLGNVAFARGDAATAIQHFRRAVELAPHYDMARRNLEIAMRSAENPFAPVLNHPRTK